MLLARVQVAKEAERMPCAKENCGNIKSLISGVVFFVVVVASFVVVAFSPSRASVLYKLHFTFGSTDAEENSRGGC